MNGPQEKNQEISVIPFANSTEPSTWGMIPVGTSRMQVRHIVLAIGIAAWLLPTLVLTGVQGIVWFAFNLSFVLILIVVSSAVRSLALQRLAICFFAGGLAMGVTVAVCMPLMSLLGASPIRPFIIVPIEELFKLAPALFLLWRGRTFSSWTLGATDVLLMGACAGAGFAFVEDAYSHAVSHAALNNLSVWMPSSELINGRVVSGHGVWTGLAASTIGLASLFRHLGAKIKWATFAFAALGIAISTTDHLALNYNQTQGALPWGSAFFNFVSANGALPLILFLIFLAVCMACDFFVQLRSLPPAREFKLPTRKNRKESLQILWDSVLDLRRLAYANYRYKHKGENDCPSALAMTTAILAKRLINRYLADDLPASTGSNSVSSLAIRGPEQARTMPRGPGQVAPPDFGKMGMPTAELPLPDATAVDSTVVSRPPGPISGQRFGGSSVTGERPLIMPFDNRPLKEFLDLPEQYEIFEEVSEGGMGVIFRGLHRRTGARLAIKVLHPHLSSNHTHLRRFEQEARTASTLDHPNIVIVHDFGITPNSIAYLVMEWLDGSNLDPVIKIGGTLSLDRFIKIFLQATSALAHAHRKGVIHRDIKPSNIILASTPEKPDFVKIVDFGIAKVLTDESDMEMSLTRTGDILGSPLFMSPEQCMGNKMDARSDIYSLGCVMYEALVGVTPLRGENAVQLIYKHVHEMPKQPRQIKPDISLPDVMEPLLFKCLQKDPAQRYNSMEELEIDLLKVKTMLAKT